jgi:hypothetical protein
MKRRGANVARERLQPNGLAEVTIQILARVVDDAPVLGAGGFAHRTRRARGGRRRGCQELDCDLFHRDRVDRHAAATPPRQDELAKREPHRARGHGRHGAIGAPVARHAGEDVVRDVVTKRDADAGVVAPVRVQGSVGCAGPVQNRRGRIDHDARAPVDQLAASALAHHQHVVGMASLRAQRLPVAQAAPMDDLGDGAVEDDGGFDAAVEYQASAGDLG